MLACLDNDLKSINLEWHKQTAVCVILASGGYPLQYQKGYEITGLKAIPKDIILFHAGTKQEGHKIVTAGGRVLGVTALAENKEQAIAQAYNAVELIRFQDMHYRTDIGQRK